MKFANTLRTHLVMKWARWVTSPKILSLINDCVFNSFCGLGVILYLRCHALDNNWFRCISEWRFFLSQNCVWIIHWYNIYGCWLYDSLGSFNSILDIDWTIVRAIDFVKVNNFEGNLSLGSRKFPKSLFFVEAVAKCLQDYSKIATDILPYLEKL